MSTVVWVVLLMLVSFQVSYLVQQDVIAPLCHLLDCKDSTVRRIVHR